MTRNRTIVEKADIAVSNLYGGTEGGYLNPMQANTFIRMLIDQPTLVNQVRVVPMNAPTMEINKIGFASRILKAAPSSGTALASSDRSAPTTEKVSLSTQEVIAEVHIPYDVLEDNIERGSLEDTIMQLISQRASLDIEDLIINGNTSTGADAYMQLMNGLLAITTSNVVDYTATRPAISASVFKAGVKAMPNRYMRNRAAMRFFTSPDTQTEWVDIWATRLTAAGDVRLAGGGNPPAYGIPVEATALMPNSQYILTYPKNIVLGVQRQIMIETDRDIRARTLIVVLTMRLDLEYEEEEAAVKCTGLNPNADTTTTTTTT